MIDVPPGRHSQSEILLPPPLALFSLLSLSSTLPAPRSSLPLALFSFSIFSLTSLKRRKGGVQQTTVFDSG